MHKSALQNTDGLLGGEEGRGVGAGEEGEDGDGFHGLERELGKSEGFSGVGCFPET